MEIENEDTSTYKSTEGDKSQVHRLLRVSDERGQAMHCSQLSYTSFPFREEPVQEDLRND